MKCGNKPSLLRAVALLVLLAPAAAQAQQVRVNKLVNVAFGTIANFTTDQTIAQNICVFTTPLGTRYEVAATGNGTGGAFTLASGANTLAYEVQWAATSGQTTGTTLNPGVALTFQTTAATITGCTSGPTTSASLITILRTAAIGSARSGSYTGVLTLLLRPN